MSNRHLFSSLEGLVPKALRGIVASNPRLNLDEANRVVFDPASPRSTVSIISGGGSGHEPAWAGYVGSNMLAASVAGDVFASPSTKQILAAVDAVPSDKGTLLVITNYTGDCLHFGLAAEKTKAKGRACRMLICGDDVSIGKKSGSLVGRRGLAGQIGVLKILGAAAAQGASLDALYDLGTAVNSQIVSIAATLDHCHVPGRTEHGALDADEIEIGTGPHNEPGYRKLSPAPTAQELVRQVLKYCLDETDPERGYVHFQPGDETALLVSNFGGMSNLELGGLVDELLTQLHTDWHIEPVRVYAGCLETSLNAPAFSVSVINLSGVAAANANASSSAYSLEQIKEFLDLRTDTAWEAVAGCQKTSSSPGERRRPRADQIVRPLPSEGKKVVLNDDDDGNTHDTRDLRVDPALLEAMLREACAALVREEPDLTRWDTAMGDGDCGLTLKTGADALRDAVDRRRVAARGSVVEVLAEVEDILESRMGGTLGGILGIFFVALRTAVEANCSRTAAAAQGGGGGGGGRAGSSLLLSVWAKSLATALQHLAQYTPAKVGDRTVMDTLIPFAEAMRATQSFDDAVAAAVRGAEATKTMKPRLGRATYVGTGVESNKELPPDPGAWGAMVVIRALQTAMQGSAPSTRTTRVDSKFGLREEDLGDLKGIASV
ncbi:Dak1 domain-containing protein [Chaetomium strumarium]|uniref:Dak1 domain-containing protein n=1 Tax=Chaetomium strumarium TaxID=1170767 RepID=A0AAJ0GVB6_9PEZI|nr:Dak1 domain-containing protein [Chaetomium strumarium]